ncbi:MAG: MbnP family protein [Saprospiraceae bacterium]|nr:MbnP family protein [Saprospiraceae bacterium]
MKQISKVLLLAILSATTLFTACKKDSEDTTPGTVEVEFDHRWGTQVFNLNQSVVTPAGDSASFTTFKYFVSNVKLLKDDGTEYAISNSYYLVNQDSAASKTLTFKDVPAGKYTGVKFMIGVDSAMSASALDKRTGVLDPATGAKGMYWAWNSGYIFTKLEGISPSAPMDSATQKRRFWYHIGGFGGYSSKTINNLKTVTIKSTTDAATVSGSTAPTIHFIVDVKEFFQNPTALSIKSNPIVMFAPYSTTIADNYQDMIRFDHIHN